MVLSTVGWSDAKQKAYLSMTSEFVRIWPPGRLPVFKLLSRSAPCTEGLMLSSDNLRTGKGCFTVRCQQRGLLQAWFPSLLLIQKASSHMQGGSILRSPILLQLCDRTFKMNIVAIPACHCCSSMECKTWTRDGPDEEKSPAQECRAGCSALCPSWLSLSLQRTCFA